MFYPARWKKITVDQSKVLKNRLYRLFRFYWATRYISNSGRKDFSTYIRFVTRTGRKHSGIKGELASTLSLFPTALPRTHPLRTSLSWKVIPIMSYRYRLGKCVKKEDGSVNDIFFFIFLRSRDQDGWNIKLASWMVRDRNWRERKAK